MAGTLAFLALFCMVWMKIQAGVIIEDPTAASIQAFHRLEDNSLDVLVIGQSHSWVGIRADMLNEKGLNSYNYSGNWQKANTSVAFLKDALMTQKPKLVIFETYNVGIELNEDIKGFQGEMYTTKNIPSREIKYEYLQSVYKNKWLFYPEYELPLLIFHNNWKTWGTNYRTTEETIKDFVDSAGWLKNEDIKEIDISGEHGESPLNETGEKYLQQILSLCRGSGAELLLITLPTSSEFSYTLGVEQFAEKNQLKYLNYYDCVEECGFDGSSDFYDSAHLNMNGATKATEYLYDYLCENYVL